MNRTLIGFLRKEFIQSLRDPRMRVVLFIVPMLQMGLFGFAISTEFKNIKIAAQVGPNDPILQHIVDRSINAGWFIPARGLPKKGSDFFYDWIDQNLADVVLVGPPGGLTRALNQSLFSMPPRRAPLQVLINATNATKAQTIEGYLTAIANRVVIEDLKLPGLSPPIEIEQRILFNSDLSTPVFMVPGIMGMLMVVTTMILANVAIVREKEMGTFEMLISAPVPKSTIIYGKTIPYVVLGMANFPLILGVAVWVFHVPMRGSLLVMALAAFAFVCVAVALGCLISTFCKNQQQATLSSFLVIFPMVMFSGLMFPIENMPPSMKWMATLDPLSHFLGLMRNIMLKGGGDLFVLEHLGVLVAMAVALILTSLLRFKTKL